MGCILSCLKCKKYYKEDSIDELVIFTEHDNTKFYEEVRQNSDTVVL